MEKPKNSKAVPWNMTGTRKEQSRSLKSGPCLKLGQGGGGRSHPAAVTNSSPAAFKGISSSGKNTQEGHRSQNPAKAGHCQIPSQDRY